MNCTVKRFEKLKTIRTVVGTVWYSVSFFFFLENMKQQATHTRSTAMEPSFVIDAHRTTEHRHERCPDNVEWHLCMDDIDKVIVEDADQQYNNKTKRLLSPPLFLVRVRTRKQKLVSHTRNGNGK